MKKRILLLKPAEVKVYYKEAHEEIREKSISFEKTGYWSNLLFVDFDNPFVEDDVQTPYHGGRSYIKNIKHFCFIFWSRNKNEEICSTLVVVTDDEEVLDFILAMKNMAISDEQIYETVIESHMVELPFSQPQPAPRTDKQTEYSIEGICGEFY